MGHTYLRVLGLFGFCLPEKRILKLEGRVADRYLEMLGYAGSGLPQDFQGLTIREAFIGDNDMSGQYGQTRCDG